MEREMTWRGSRKRRARPRKVPAPTRADRRGERPCVVCAAPTLHRQTVAAWEAPCCPDHSLHRDYRVSVVVGFGRPPTFGVVPRVATARELP